MLTAIVDKPFAVSSKDADHVIELADEKGLIVTCFQNRRWARFSETTKYEQTAYWISRMPTFKP